MSQPKRKTTSTHARKKVDQPPAGTSPSPPQEGSATPSTTRAEEMFNQAGQRIREFTARLTTPPGQAAPPHTKSTNQPPSTHALPSGLDTERAEQMLTSAEERIERFAARLAARTREEVEDIWAEAQSIRHRGQS